MGLWLCATKFTYMVLHLTLREKTEMQHTYRGKFSKIFAMRNANRLMVS
jgi:hypothetical protein